MANYELLEKNKVLIKDAKIIFRNFAGNTDKYNKNGEKNFAVIIEDPDLAQYLADRTWNVRISKPRREDDIPYNFLPVKVSFYSSRNITPARVTIISKGVETLLDEETISLLDGADIEYINLIIRPRPYVDERTGEDRIKAYLDQMDVWIATNRLEELRAEREHPEDF